MSTPNFDDLQEYVEDSLGEHRDILEELAELDTELSEDARRALQILDEGDDQS